MKVIRGGTVVTAADATLADVLIDGETIAEVGTIGEVDAEVIDATGCFVLPGAVDPHTHLKMPFGGTWSIDDYDTGTQAAAAGGTTSIVDFALQMHPDGLVDSLAEWQGRAEGTAHIDYGFHMAITNATAPTIADMGAMVEAGVTTFKVFLAYRGVLMVTDDQFLRVLQESKATGGLVMVHAENGDAIDLLVHQALAAGRTEPKVHAETRPEIFEAEATSRAVRIAEYAGTPIYIVHVTCQGAAAEIIAGRARGVDAMGETCIQYVTLDVSDLARPGLDGFEGARYVCSPPLRDPVNQPFLWDAIANDHLQVLSTDHCPFTDEQKALGLGDFSKIPNGLALIQHRVNLLWEHGVREGRLTPSRAVELLSTAPARIFGLTTKGELAPGKDADVAILDPEREHVFSRETSLMAVDYDVFEGRRTHGSVRTTLVRGTTVWDDGTIHTRPGHGRFVARSTYGGS